MSDTAETKFDSWAMVELFGHQKIVGKVTESTIAGGAFLRVDVPAWKGDKAFTRFYGPGAIYSINPVTEEIAIGLLERYRHEPVNRYELPQVADKVREEESQENVPWDDGHDDEGVDDGDEEGARP
jgi:hypothetical protein